MYKSFFKRFIDIILSVLAIVCLSPVLSLVAIMVRIKHGSPIIYKQARPGKNEKIFFVYKFRSMTNEKDTEGKLLPDNKRLTKFGKFIRKSSIDELPELFNILKGDMSIVGPRPLTLPYLPYYTDKERKRHDLRPGLTGLAQISGRNNLSWEDKFELDLSYCENLSFINDIKIIINTALKVFKGSGVQVRDSNPLKNFSVYRSVSNYQKVNNNIKVKEIGGFFEAEDKNEFEDSAYKLKDFLPQVYDESFTFSGRSAIRVILEDLMESLKPKNVYLPNLCPVSIVHPFIKKDLLPKFYEINLENGFFNFNLPDIQKNDIVLIRSYFGLNVPYIKEVITEIKKNGAIIIEDITPSFFNLVSHSIQSDYYFVSLRQWFPIVSAGWVGKREGILNYKPSLASNHAIEDPFQAMQDKKDFLKGKDVNKDSFLINLSKFETDIFLYGPEVKISDLSLEKLKKQNFGEIIEKRKRNCKILFDEISSLNSHKISLPILDLENEVLLYFPIFLNKEDRDSLKHRLEQDSIFCPIHWQEKIGTDNDIRNRELSIVCDQRYNIEDMKRIVNSIKAWIQTQK